MVSDLKYLENVTDPKITHYKGTMKGKKLILEALTTDTRAESILSS